MSLKIYLDQNGYKLVKSIFCFLTFMGLGGVCTLLGSSLLDIQISIQQDFVTTSKLIPVRSIGYITGGIFSAFLEKFSNINVIMALTNFTGGLFLIFAPWFTSIYIVACFIYLSGISQGLFDISLSSFLQSAEQYRLKSFNSIKCFSSNNHLYSNVYIIKIWGKDSTNYLQIHHMFFGVGALIIPLVTRPFLLPFQREDEIIEERSINVNLSSSATKLPFGGFEPDDVTIQYPYMINGIFLCLVSIGFIIFYFKDKQIPSNDCKSNDNGASSSNQSPQCSNNTASVENRLSQDVINAPWKKYVAIIPMMLIANIAFGFTTTVGSLGPSFAVKSDIAMTKKTAALLITVFWTMFCFYRLIFIPLSRCFSHRRLMLFNLILILISVGLMVTRAANNSYFTWAAFILLGTGYSPTFSVSFALLQEYFPISGRLASFIFMNGCIGESIHPWLVAKFMEGWPEFFVYYLGGMCIVYVILNFSLPHLCNLIFKKPSILHQ